MKKWIALAENLSVGQKTRTSCPTDCGSGDTLSVNHDHKRYWCSCFRCGHTDQHDKGTQTLSQIKRLRELNEAAETIQLPLELPDDFTNDIPRHGRAWLFKAGLTPPAWKLHNIGYSESLDRVILPVYDTAGNLEWYQCRALLKGQTPKYLQPARDRSKIMLRLGFDREDIQRVVVVEDILSAYRVGKHITTASLLGTKISTAQAAELSNYPRITTWLDNDKAGKDGAYKIRKTLGLVTEVDNIVTDVDPKELSDKEIKQCLNIL